MSFSIWYNFDTASIDYVNITGENGFYDEDVSGHVEDPEPSGFTRDVTLTCYPNDGYQFVQWNYRFGSFSGDEYHSTANPLTIPASSIGTRLIITATCIESGGGGGDYHYACYNITTGEYVSGYTDKQTDASSITRPSISGLTYQGYVYHRSFADCLEYRIDEGYDGTETTCSDHSASLPYVVFFYTGTPAPTGKYHYACYDEATNSYIDGYEDIATDNVPITAPAISGYTYNGYIYWDTFQRCVDYFLREGTYDSYSDEWPGYTSNNHVVFFYTGSNRGFDGDIQPTGITTAVLNAIFTGGASAIVRYIRVKLNGSWVKVKGVDYLVNDEGAGLTSTFANVPITGLSENTLYSYEVHLYYINGSGAYVDTGFALTGSFRTNQSATGLLIYVNGWRDAIPYVYTNGAWHRAYSRMYINGEWEGNT